MGVSHGVIDAVEAKLNLEGIFGYRVTMTQMDPNKRDISLYV